MSLNYMGDDDERMVLLPQSLIDELIQICNDNKVEIPDGIKSKLLEQQQCPQPEAYRTHTEFLVETRTKELESFRQDPIAQTIKRLMEKLHVNVPLLELRIKNGSYKVVTYLDDDSALDQIKKHTLHHQNSEEAVDIGTTNHSTSVSGRKRATQKIRTIRTESPITKLFSCFVKCIINKGNLRKESKEKVVMDGVNLVLEQGKMYLVLGAPGCGKSTLLKMIANKLPQNKLATMGGEVTLSGYSSSEKKFQWTNLVGYIDQIDRMHPYLTVFETFMFAWTCRSGGTHLLPNHGTEPEVAEEIAKMDKEKFTVHRMLDVLGLTRVKDTFVGDQTTVRGVSGGEKRRVTVGEMFVCRTPVSCCDEISTGLDAATTYEITRVMSLAARLLRNTSIVSLLQPPPETVANFDELILLSEGKIIYMGPISSVENHFNLLGYVIPERMDLADWLQELPTPNGWQYLKEAKDGHSDPAALKGKHLSTQQFHDLFYASAEGIAILEKLNEPAPDGGKLIADLAAHKYKNSALASLKLVVQRELLLWWRDKYQIKAKIAQCTIMSVVVGSLFFQAKPNIIVSVLFQSMFYTVVGVMVQLAKQFSDRPIFYKHQDANFFPTWCYIIARTIATIPLALIDGIGYGTIVYFLSGLAFNQGDATIASYFTFVLLMIVTSMTSSLFFSVFSSCMPSITTAQAAMAVSALVFILFSGFTVQPDVIPVYYIWIYHINYFAWVFRAFMVNEFDSGRYNTIVGEANGVPITEGESYLIRFGFVDRNDEPFAIVYVWYGILFAVATATVSVLLALRNLSSIRFTVGKSLVDDPGDDEVEEIPDSEKVEIPFTKVNLTFKNIHYTVTSSITHEKLELLKGVDGVVESGKMTALMGSSGAGKTTLMDVIAMRKNTGEITGEICLNGHPQEEMSFRRCMGYVEQFDTQSPQLTIAETCQFSAKLRLEETDPLVTPENISKFVQQALNMLELTNIQDLQVGSDAEGGLSFEQRKRLSIAVELVANPSILFLDEPTSGLDARAAAVVMRGLKRVALSGRAVCATIHQPSIAVFEDFDRLLLLKRGGEVVYFGDLGDHCKTLIQYLERYDATPRIQPGENPATWMLTAIGAGSGSPDKMQFDYAGNYIESKLHAHCLELIDSITSKATEDEKVWFRSEYATSSATQANAVLFRTLSVYYRSPSYNSTRMVVSAIVALLFGTVYASQRVPQNESDMNSRINSMYIALLFLSVNAQNTVLSVFELERNMYYRHKAANMYGSPAILRAFTIAELPFILVASTIFSVPFYFIMGFAIDAAKFFTFYAFVFLALANFTFFGQMLVSLFRDSATAQGFGGLLVTFTSLFAGILIREGDIPTFWIFMYWITPGHYIFEGMFMSQFTGDDTMISATVGSPFYSSIGCTSTESDCKGTVDQWMTVNFPDFSVDNVKYNALFLVVLILATRTITLYALAYINHKSN